MMHDFGVEHWNNIKLDFKDKFPFLTDSDLEWRDGYTKIDLLKVLAARIGINWKELEEIVDKF